MTASMKRAVAGFFVDSLIGRSAARQGKQVAGIDPGAREELARAAWHGDVQQLQRDVERIVAATRDGRTITTAALEAVGRKARRT